MNYLFIGLLFVFLNFNLNLGTITIGLIPDFVSYIFMLKGIRELTEESDFFVKAKPYVTSMGIFTGILYFLNLLGLSIVFQNVISLLSIVAIVVSLYITYLFVMGINEMEDKYNCSFNGTLLKSAWRYMMVLTILIYILMLIPALLLVCFITNFIINVYFLITFHNTKKLYYERYS